MNQQSTIKQNILTVHLNVYFILMSFLILLDIKTVERSIAIMRRALEGDHIGRPFSY